MASIYPMEAQADSSTSPAPSTPEQLALVDQIQGLKDIKFGATLDSFDKSLLKAVQEGPTYSIYQYLKTDGITWGTFTPSYIELQFYYGQLIGISFSFNEENGDLIAMYKAALQKYGASESSYGNVPFINGGYSGPSWTTSNIQMIVALPQDIPAGDYGDFLKKKGTGAVALLDIGLRKKISSEKLEAAKQEMQKAHDLDKIET
ncbi:MAG TPA: hypothetical protein VGC39_11795, partial [Candidatus Methylacidiphilales bacterium]